MDDKLNKVNRKFTTITVMLVALSLGCFCLPTTLTSTGTQTDKSTLTPPATHTLPASAVDAVGPWLLIETDAGLWAANADGSGLTQFTTIDYWHADLQTAIQPNGNQVVFITSGNYDFHNMTLNLLSLPDGSITKITDLTSPETEAYANSSPGDPGFEALRAIGEQPGYAWSPNGTRLAFIGAMDGPSAEVYLYDIATRSIQRVSQDDSQNYGLSWSPDGNTLLYFGANAFGSGAGFDTTGAWSASGDGTSVTQLFVPEGGAEELVGWLDNTTAVLDTWTPGCGKQALRLFDIPTTSSTMLNEGCFISAAADGWLAEAVYANDSGLFFLNAEDRTPVQVSPEAVARIEPVRPRDSMFTVHFQNGNVTTYGNSEMENQVSPFNVPSGESGVVMYGMIWGWTSSNDAQPGVWISGPGLEIGQIYTGKAIFPIWDLHNNLLFFTPEGTSGFNIQRTTFDAYYQDLSQVGFVGTKVLAVAWLGNE